MSGPERVKAGRYDGAGVCLEPESGTTIYKSVPAEKISQCRVANVFVVVYKAVSLIKEVKGYDPWV